MATENRTFDLSRALVLARASEAAYADSISTIARELSADSVDGFSLGPAAGFVARVGREVILAFRGTVCPLPEWEQSLVQWIANLNFGQVPAAVGRVHRGFSQAVDRVWSHVSQRVNKACTDPASHLWITGHSLGGALAILAGARLAAEGPMPTGVYTFGAPSVGDEHFAAAYKPILHRVETGSDIVCHLPPPRALVTLVSRLYGKLNLPADAAYGPIGSLTYLEDNGKRRTALTSSEQRHLSLWRVARLTMAAADTSSLLVSDHSIATYLARLHGSYDGGQSILHDVPAWLLTALRNGVLRRKGPTLRDVQTNETVTQMQGTTWLERLLGTGKPGGFLLSAANLAASLHDSRQLDEIKSLLGTLQFLSAANLAATVVGVGISVAGFALVCQRLKQVELIAQEAREEALKARLAIERHELREAIRNKSETLHLLGRADAAWSYSDPVRVWKELDAPMHRQLTYEQCLLGRTSSGSILLDARFPFEESVAAYESVLLLATAHVQTLLLAGEESAAAHYAARFLQWHEETLLPVRPDAIARAKSPALAWQLKIGEDDARQQLLRQAEQFKKQVIEIHSHAEARVGLIRYLQEQGIRGRTYIEAARERTDTPFLLLPMPR